MRGFLPARMALPGPSGRRVSPSPHRHGHGAGGGWAWCRWQPAPPGCDAAPQATQALTRQHGPPGMGGSSSICAANNVTTEYRPNKAGVVQAIAFSDYWRWVSMPRCARACSNVTSTCNRCTHHWRIWAAPASGLVQRNAWASNVPWGSRTSLYRMGTAGRPL
jgi:hypothetical protein